MGALSYTVFSFFCSFFCCKINSSFYHLSITYLSEVFHSFGWRSLKLAPWMSKIPRRSHPEFWQKENPTVTTANSVQKLFLSRSDAFRGGGGEEGFYFLKSVYADFFFSQKRILPHCNTFVRSNTVLHIQRNPKNSVPFFGSSSDPRLLKHGWNMTLWCLGFIHWMNLSEERAEESIWGAWSCKGQVFRSSDLE